MQSNDSIIRATNRYQGIQGLYFLNKKGDLGYITSDSSRAVRETFPQMVDKKFIKRHPDFLDQIEGFLRQSGEIPFAYLQQGKAAEIELGYVLPPGEHQSWTTCNFMLHRKVIEAIRSDARQPAEADSQTPFVTEAAEQRFQGVRSVYRGFADLLYYKNRFGVGPYFPVLFKLPGHDLLSPTPGEQAPLRVLNLKWSRDADTPGSAQAHSRFPAVFSILRANMVKRGAINREVTNPIIAAS